MKQTLTLRIAGVLLLQILWWLMLPDSLKQRIEWPVQDFLTRQTIQPLEHFDSRIAIIDIDEFSLSSEGRWPWQRDIIAELIDQLQYHYQVLFIGSDIIFPDSSEQQDRLVQSMTQADVTTTLLWHPDPSIRKGQWQGTATCSDCSRYPQAQGWITNTQELTAKEQAHITPEIDGDGSVRRINPLVCHQDQCIEMLALSLFRQVLDIKPAYQRTHQLLKDPSGLIQIPLLNDGSYLINWQNSAGKVPYVSAVDVLHQRIHDDALRGKVVIIGSSSAGLHDLVPTPIAARFPAVEIHALLLQSLLDQEHRQQPRYSLLIAFLASMCLSLLLLFADKKRTIVKYIPICIAGMLAWTLWVTYQKSLGYDWPLTPVIVSTLLTLGWLLPIALKEQTQLKNFIHQQFSAYVPPSVVEQLIQSPEQAIGITPERHVVTILFADLRHFSRFSETKTPEELAEILRRIMDQLTDIVHHHNGTVDKYIGDAIMAFWGAPLPQTDHAHKAVQAAIKMCHSIQDFRYQQAMLPCTLSVGINTGDVVVGDLGSSARRSYSICGTAVNIAAHLEENTRKTHYPIMVGEQTFTALDSQQQKELFWQPSIELNIYAHTHPLKAYPLDPFQTSR